MMSERKFATYAVEDLKTQVKTLKRELKAWEHEFVEEYGHKPTKKDISGYPEISGRYKLYAKLKASLEEQNENSGVTALSPLVTSATGDLPLSPKEPVEPTLPPAPPSTENLRSSSRKVNLLSGPVSKADIGQNVNRFARKVQERKESIKDSEGGIVTYAAEVDQFSNTVGEVDEFFQRKNEIDHLKSSQKLYKAEEKVTSVTSAADFSIDKPTVQKVESSNNYKVIQVESNLGSTTISEPVLPIAESNTELRRQEELEETPKPPPKLAPFQNGVQMDEGPRSASTPSLPPKLAPLTTDVSKDQSNSLASPNSIVSKEEKGSEERLAGALSDSAGSPLGEMIEPEQEQAPTSQVEATDPNASNDPMQLPSKNLPSVAVSNCFQRIVKAGILRCKFVRKKTLLKGQQLFYLYNELDNSFLLAAKKNIISKTTNYIISDHPDVISKDSPHCVAKLKANFMRTSFILSDVRSPSKAKEIALVNYSKNVLPRELKVAISAVSIAEDAATGYTDDIVTDFEHNNTDLLLFLNNKAPKWNEKTQSHCLNFGGRVTQPSIKNMQLISYLTGEKYNVLQFGRCSTDSFTLDVRWPMTPAEAFGIAITTFDAYDSA